MHLSANLYFTSFLIFSINLLRIRKIEPQNVYKERIPQQLSCMSNSIKLYKMDENFFSKLPTLINKCSYSIISQYFQETRVSKRALLFMPPQTRNNNPDLQHEFISTLNEDRCWIILSNSQIPDIRLEKKLKSKYNNCSIARVSPEAIETNEEDLVKFYPFQLTLSPYKDRSDKSVDIQTFVRSVLKTQFVEAIHFDESTKYYDLWRFHTSLSISKTIPACQITVTINRPRNANDELYFSNFIPSFLLNEKILTVSSRKITENQIEITFFNAKNEFCNFKHLSIPFYSSRPTM